MAIKADPVDMMLDILKIGIIIIVGYILISALLSIT